MIERHFDREKMYRDIIHFYINKKGYSPDNANRIAQLVVTRESKRRTCATCGHMNHDHITNTGTCLYVDCDCYKFVSQLPGATR